MTLYIRKINFLYSLTIDKMVAYVSTIKKVIEIYCILRKEKIDSSFKY